jgi:hypothetical protein
MPDGPAPAGGELLDSSDLSDQSDSSELSDFSDSSDFSELLPFALQKAELLPLIF